MRTFYKLIIIITSIFIVAVIIRSCWSDNNKSAVSLDAQDVTFHNFERNKVSIDKAFKTITRFKYDLIRPIIMKKYRGELYICDYGDMKIVRVDTSGTVINTIGGKLGKGPGEFTQIMDFSFYDDSIFILDLNKMMIMEFTLDGNYMRSVTLQDRTTRLVSFHSGFITLYLGGKNLFKKLNKQGKEIDRFGTLIENQQQNTLSLGGIIEPINEEIFLYAPAYASVVYYFNYNGVLISYTNLPAGQPFSSSKKNSDGNIRRTMRPNPLYQTYAVSQTPEYVYLLEYKRAEENIPESEAHKHRALYLNVINKHSKKYVKSYQFHEVVEEPVVIDGKIYAIQNDTGLVYHRIDQF